MSCGLTPEVMRLIEKMQSGEIEADAAAAAAAAAGPVRRAPKKTPPSDDGSYDWTRTYAKWDAWEDEDDISEREAEAKRRAARSANRGLSACDHDHSAEREVYEMPMSDKLTACAGFRDAGNAFFREGQFVRALDKYRRALVYYEYAFPETPEDVTAMETVKRQCALNAALCCLNLRDYGEVVNLCSQVLRSDPTCVKALYRRAQAYRHTDEYDKASADIMAALSVEPGDAAVHRELMLLNNKKRNYEAHSRALYKRMLGRAGAADGVPGATTDDVNGDDDAGVVASFGDGGSMAERRGADVGLEGIDDDADAGPLEGLGVETVANDDTSPADERAHAVDDDGDREGNEAPAATLRGAVKPRGARAPQDESDPRLTYKAKRLPVSDLLTIVLGLLIAFCLALVYRIIVVRL